MEVGSDVVVNFCLGEALSPLLYLLGISPSHKPPVLVLLPSISLEILDC